MTIRFGIWAAYWELEASIPILNFSNGVSGKGRNFANKELWLVLWKMAREVTSQVCPVYSICSISKVPLQGWQFHLLSELLFWKAGATRPSFC
jgi:hypothetical protein